MPIFEKSRIGIQNDIRECSCKAESADKPDNVNAVRRKPLEGQRRGRKMFSKTLPI